MTPNVSGLLLTHGAGSDPEHPTSLAIEQQVHPLPVRRMNFPYRQRPGKRPPDRAEVLLDSLRSQDAAFAAQVGCTPDTLALGGRSMGGRICSMAIAQGLPAAALILMSYPCIRRADLTSSASSTCRRSRSRRW